MPRAAHHHLQQAAGAIDGDVGRRVEPRQASNERSPPFTSTVTCEPTSRLPSPRMV